MQVELKHTWVIPKRAWYIRVYLWVWEASPADITFCKLFWSYALLWIGLPLRLLFGVVRTVRAVWRAAGSVRSRNRQVRSETTTPLRLLVPSRVTTGRRFKVRIMEGWAASWWVDGERLANLPSHREFYWRFSELGPHTIRVEGWSWINDRYDLSATVVVVPVPLEMRILEAVASGVSWAIMHRGAVVRPLRVAAKPVGYVATRKPVRWTSRQITLALVLCLLALTIPVFVSAGTYVGHEAPILLRDAAPTALVIGLAGIAGIAVLSFLLLLTGIPRAIYQVMLTPAKEQTVRGALGFREMMKIGYVAVKSNTCPRVIVEEEGDE